MSAAEREALARLALVEAGVIAQEAIDLVARYPQRATQIVAEARRLLAQRRADG